MVKKRIVILIGENLHNLHTLSLFIDQDNLNIVGACVANEKKAGINFSYLKRAIKKEGLFKVILQIIQRIVYKLLNSRKDKKIHKSIFNETLIKNKISSWKGPIHYTDNYQKNETYNWIKRLNPDIIVVHTPYWVGRQIREIVNGQIIGGHPGITPDYRGIHASFWALYNQEPDKVGYSVFWLDKGVDTGDLIIQGKLEIDKGDSYITLGWKGMIKITEAQINFLKKLNKGEKIPRKKHTIIPPNSYYSHPTIFNYIKYMYINGKRIR